MIADPKGNELEKGTNHGDVGPQTGGDNSDFAPASPDNSSIGPKSGKSGNSKF